MIEWWHEWHHCGELILRQATHLHLLEVEEVEAAGRAQLACTSIVRYLTHRASRPIKAVQPLELLLEQILIVHRVDAIC